MASNSSKRCGSKDMESSSASSSSSLPISRNHQPSPPLAETISPLTSSVLSSSSSSLSNSSHNNYSTMGAKMIRATSYRHRSDHNDPPSSYGKREIHNPASSSSAASSMMRQHTKRLRFWYVVASHRISPYCG